MVLSPNLLFVDMNPPYLMVEVKGVLPIDLKWRKKFLRHLKSFLFTACWLLF